MAALYSDEQFDFVVQSLVPRAVCETTLCDLTPLSSDSRRLLGGGFRVRIHILLIYRTGTEVSHAW